MLSRPLSLLLSIVALPAVLFFAPAVGATVGTTEDKAASSLTTTSSSLAPDLGASALQMVLGLIVVLGLLLGTLWLLKRLSQPRGPIAGLMRVVAGVSVGPRERVVILELGDSWLVLGVAPGQVSTLAEIPRQDSAATPGNPLPAPAAAEFIGQLAAKLRRQA